MATIDKVSGTSFTNASNVDSIVAGNISSIDGVSAPSSVPLLLDTTYGSGAEAAYSVRKLRSAYTGAAIQVQDTVGGATAEIGFDVNNNLDTATLLAFAGTNEIRVSKWYDQSSNGNDALQQTVLYRPIIVSAGGTLVEQENRAALNFIRTSGGETLYAGTLGGQTSTFFSVFTPDNGNSQWIFNFDSDNTPALRSEGPFSFTDFVDGVSYSGTYKAGDFFERILIRGESFATQTSPEFKLNSRLSNYSPANPGKNHMQEAIIYSSVKSASDNVSIEENIGSYYTENQAPYLLDTYSGAAAAYSLRKLRTDYTGSVIRVRRSSDNTEQDIGFNPFGELDTVSLLAFAGTGDAFVKTWYDQSGSSNDATQAATTRQPQIVSGGAVILDNGKPAVQFDGTNDGFGISAVGAATAKFGFITHSIDPTSTQWSLFSNSFGGDVIPLAQSGSNAAGVFGYTMNNIYKDGLSISPNTRGDIYNAYTSAGQSLTVLDFSGSDAVDSLFNRVSFLMKGTAQEVILYASDQSANRSGIETNTNTFYNIYNPTLAPLLLNSYPGAAVAYSLRQLSTSYTGSSILVQDNTGGATKAIDFDANGNLNTAELIAYGGVNDVFVVSWYDQSGNSNNATQASAAARPQIYDGTTGVVTENGKPAVQFDGSNDIMVSTNTYTPTASQTQGLVVKGLASSVDQIIGDDNDRKNGMGLRIQNGNFNYYNGQTTNHSSIAITANDNQNFHFYGRNNLSTFYARLNGFGSSKSIPSISTTAVNIYLGARLGGSLSLDGNMQEYILYLSSQSANETGIETNVGGYYDIVLPGILNDFPGAAAGYSLRRLNSTYTGSAIQVQDNVGGSPLNIGFDSYGDLDTAAIVTYGGVNDVFVDTWYDQSGNGNNATQATAANRPKIYDGTTGAVIVDANGKPSLNFKAGDFIADTTWNGASTSYIFNVLQSNGSESSPRIGVDVGSSVEYYGLGINSNSGASSAGIGSIVQRSNGATIGATRDAMWDAMQFQNVLTVSGDFSSWTGGFGLTRSGQKMYTFAQEFIIYNSDESANRSKIETNIGNYYGITLSGILNDFPGAAAGYSLRRLSTTYTGSAVKVQDDVGGATFDIGFDSSGQLDTRALVGYGGSNDVFVTTWYDQSGNGNNVTQATSANRPKIYDGTTGAVITENGKPAVSFDGVDDFMLSALQFTNTDKTIQIVYTPQESASYAFGILNINTITRARFYLQTGSATANFVEGNPSVFNSVSSTQTQQLFYIDWTNSNYQFNFAVDGNTVQNATGNANTPVGVKYMLGAINNGADAPFGSALGKYQEVIIYDSDESANRTGIETNINDFYEIY